MFLGAIFNQFIYIAFCDFENLCTFECPSEKNDLLRKLNRGCAYFVILSCLLIQLGVVIDVQLGWKKIWKRIRNRSNMVDIHVIPNENNNLNLKKVEIIF